MREEDARQQYESKLGEWKDYWRNKGHLTIEQEVIRAIERQKIEDAFEEAMSKSKPPVEPEK